MFKQYLLVILFLIGLTACDVKNTSNDSEVGKELSGEHPLCKLTPDFTGTYFIFCGDKQAATQTVTFAWQMKDGSYCMT